MFCIKCGTDNSDSAKFCRKCGQPMYQPKSAPEPVETKPVTPPPQAATTVPELPIPAPEPQIQPVAVSPSPPVAAAQPVSAQPAQQLAATQTAPATSSSDLGIQPNIAAALSYVAGWVTGIVFLVIGGKNEFIKFHAWQSIITFGGFSILGVILGIFSAIISFIANLTRMSGLIVVIAIIFNIIIVVFGILCTVLWIILMIKAYQSHLFKLPIAGNMAVRMMKKNPGN